MSTLDQVIRARYSVRRFKDKEVPNDQICKIIENATYAPTNCNQQLWKFIAITDQAVKDQLVKEAISNTNIARAPAVLVICYDAWDKKEAIQGASLATQNILLSATDLGIGSCPVNSFGNEQTVKKILNIPEAYLVNCFILLGYPDEVYDTTPRIKRRPYEEVLSFNKLEISPSTGRSYDTKNWEIDKLVDYQKYYCRKTFLGKEMDILDDLERDLVRQAMQTICDKKRSIIDFFSYDGGMLQSFPDREIASVNLDEETQEYVKAAVDLYCKEKKPNIKYMLFGETSGQYDLATMIYKIERLPEPLRLEGYRSIKQHLNADGELLIITRRSSFIFNLYYRIIVGLFGDDIRKTGLYAFWGPYKPIKKSVLVNELKKEGFDIVDSKSFFLIPPFFNQVLQMFFQFVKSGGTSYLHRVKHINFLTRVCDVLIGRRIKPSLFGSILVLRAKKSERYESPI
jgi:nitroreductase